MAAIGGGLLVMLSLQLTVGAKGVAGVTPALAGVVTWTGTYDVNAFAYGYLSKAVAWFTANLTGRIGNSTA